MQGKHGGKFRLKSLEGHIEFIIGSLNGLKKRDRFDLVVMNMILTESSPLLDNMRPAYTQGGILIWSGILIDEFQKAVTLAKKSGIAFKSEKRENEWWCGEFMPG